VTLQFLDLGKVVSHQIGNIPGYPQCLSTRFFGAFQDALTATRQNVSKLAKYPKTVKNCQEQEFEAILDS
jgi:hypothetical protein